MEIKSKQQDPRGLWTAEAYPRLGRQRRILEVLQDAQRRGATSMEISNRNGDLTATDNGRAIDLAALADAWRAAHLEQGAPIDSTTGIGSLAMAPRSVTVSSHGWTARLYRDLEGNVLSEVESDPAPEPKTILRYWQETWNLDAVQAAAAFGTMRVTGDGIPCKRLPFVSERATRHAALGCRIEIRPSEELTRWHTPHQGDDRWRTLINCGGRLLGFDHFPLAKGTLRALVQFEGTDTRVPSESLLEDKPRLQAAIEREAFLFVLRRGRHRLTYAEYDRARTLGISLPEADPLRIVGVMRAQAEPDPVPVTVPTDRAVRYYAVELTDEPSIPQINAHLLAALGSFAEAFVPTMILREDFGYSWAKLPTIGHVEVGAGRTMHESELCSTRLVCVDTLRITAETSDGRSWSSDVCMAADAMNDGSDSTETVLVTLAARDRLRPEQIWYQLSARFHLPYEEHQREFKQQLNAFWKPALESARRHAHETCRGGEDVQKDA